MAINLERRRKVMARSIKLGHCVCNPKKPCPCPEFQEYNVCSCAGEKMPKKTGPVKLTQYVRKAGCASKIGQADLLRILGNLPPVNHPNILVGTAAGDDAGVYKIDEQNALVQTVDVFTPCVDDAYLFGQIAAANSVSDCYAMGAKPLTALSVVCFPIDTLDGEVMEEMLRGGIEKLEEAECSLIGGHSVNDEEVKCGFAITGLIQTGRAIERNRARAGDALVLTKPIGTGMVSFAAQLGVASDAALAQIGASMATLNKDAAELMVEYEANACTDVTGYALAGHLVEMARKSGVAAEIDLSKMPVFAPVIDCIENSLMGGAIERNMEYSMAWVRNLDEANDANLPVIYDPQTSGGLLISLPPEKAERLVEELQKRGHAAAAIIGRMVEKPEGARDGEVTIINAALENILGEREGSIDMSKKNELKPTDKVASNNAEEEETACCANPPSFDDEEEGSCCCSSDDADSNCCTPASEASDGSCCCSAPEGDSSDCGCSAPAAEAAPTQAPQAFMGFLREANKPGFIDERAKKLMAIALSIAEKCEPCLRIHIQGAIKMGITKNEIDEAAWLAISFCGSPAMMFYNPIRKELLG
ncbi:MAG: selenide, water dikinase SelD [Candidatus Sumerlaeia bacterium]